MMGTSFSSASKEKIEIMNVSLNVIGSLVRGHSASGFPSSHVLLPCDALVPLGPAPSLQSHAPCQGKVRQREVDKRTEGVWGTSPNFTSSSPLRRVQGPHCFEARQTGGCGAFSPVLGSLPL